MCLCVSLMTISQHYHHGIPVAMSCLYLTCVTTTHTGMWMWQMRCGLACVYDAVQLR